MAHSPHVLDDPVEFFLEDLRFYFVVCLQLEVPRGRTDNNARMDVSDAPASLHVELATGPDDCCDALHFYAFFVLLLGGFPT